MQKKKNEDIPVKETETNGRGKGNRIEQQVLRITYLAATIGTTSAAAATTLFY